MALNKVPSLDKSGCSSITETENRVKLDTKNIYLPLSSSYDKSMEEQEPTEMAMRTNKSARDDQSCSTMTVSLYGDSIPRKKKKRNYQKLQSQGIK